MVVPDTTGADRLPLTVPVPVVATEDVKVPLKRLPVPVPATVRVPNAVPAVPVKPEIVPVCVVVPVPENVTARFTAPVLAVLTAVPELLSVTIATVLPV